MKSLKKDKIAWPEVHKEVWCLKCKRQGHEKDNYPIFTNYVELGGPMLLRSEVVERPSTGPMLWCAIYQVARKHVINNFHLLQKFVQMP